jgi:TolB-like protein/DNA-binding winged helix-turn-helix (wHTH) protein
MGYEFGDFRVDVSQRLLLLKPTGRPLPLSTRAFDTLLFFLEHPGELLEKSTLMAAIWPKAVVEENNLNQNISALRRVLGERPEEHRFIVTVPGRGYRFVAAVRSVTDATGTAFPTEGGAISAPATLAGVEPAAPESAAQAAAGRSRDGAIRWSLAAVGVALAAILGWYLTTQVIHRSDHNERTAPVSSIDVVAIRKPRLAVLPFENLSPDPNNAFFADGLHEEILSTIAERVPGVEVISRTTMMGYRANPPKPLGVVARELKASHLIEGSVRREANKVRLTLQLIDARTDVRLWSASYDRTLSDALTLESQVAEEVAAQLPAQLTRPARPAATPLRDTEAFDLYLKALLALRTFNFETAEFQQIEDLLSRAMARDPGFALAYAQRARLRTLMFISGHDTSEAFVSQIRSDLAVAQRLAPKDPIVLAATGYFLMCANDTSGGLQAFAAAEAAGLAEPEWLVPLAHLLLRRSRIEELNATVQRMLSLDPADPIVIYFAVYHLARSQQPESALQAAEYARTAFPSLYTDWRATILLEFAGRTQELRSVLEQSAPTQNPAKLTRWLPGYFQVLLYEHRYAELRTLIDRVPVASSVYYAGVDFGPVGSTPTALFRGWTDLLLTDRTAALKDGRAVLEFVGHQTRTQWNGAYLETLNAAGYTFTGDCARARAAGNNALKLVTRADNAVVWATNALNVAEVDAWCGAPDEAIGLLQQLAHGRPGSGPAEITRDPLLSVPLGSVPAYRRLTDELEAAMRTMKLEASGSGLSVR